MNGAERDREQLGTGLSPPQDQATARFRVLSGVEFLLGAGIVLGHNVFQVLPNEVPILCVLGLVSLRWRDGRWSAVGLSRPPSWRRTLLLAVVAAALRIALGEWVIEPLAARFWPPIAAPAEASAIPGNVSAALLALLFVWTFAAFGEEIAYRGYLLTRAADLGKRTPAAYVVGVVLVSFLFGYGHFYKGPAGIVDSGVAGLLLGVAYLLSGRNLWASVLTHGLIDTCAVIVLFLE
jgi:membrane protease YdiL (CAAX protease family)